MDTNLSGCPVDYNCTYKYQESIDYLPKDGIVSGNYRVFNYNAVNPKFCDFTKGIYFKTLQVNGSFQIDSNQIVSGTFVSYYDGCICCDFMPVVVPLGGYIKGKIIDANHWLINAQVIIGTSRNSPHDTLNINYYFKKGSL